MRILLPLMLVELLLLGCRKTKLKDEYAIFEGKWQWVSATETRTLLSNGVNTYTYYSASDYPDQYFMEFDRKGKVRFYKNDEMELEYRIVINNFFDNCNNFPGCHYFGIRFNNKKEMTFTGFIGYDTLLCGSRHTNLPLIFRIDDDYQYDYQHKFVKVN